MRNGALMRNGACMRNGALMTSRERLDKATSSGGHLARWQRFGLVDGFHGLEARGYE